MSIRSFVDWLVTPSDVAHRRVDSEPQLRDIKGDFASTSRQSSPRPEQ